MFKALNTINLNYEEITKEDAIHFLEGWEPDDSN